MLASESAARSGMRLGSAKLWPYVARFVALVLAAAALLKIEALSSHSIPVNPWLHSSRAVFAVGLLEIVLALWLFLGRAGPISWLVTFAFFTGAFLFALSLSFIGAAHCPCFGSVNLSPWWAAALDAWLLFLLVSARPSLDALRSAFGGLDITRHRGSRTKAALAGTSAVVALAALGATLFAPPPRVALSPARRQHHPRIRIRSRRSRPDR